jgi:hypothetical protein
MSDLVVVDVATIARAVPFLTLLGVTACLFVLLRIHRFLARQERRARGEAEEQRRQFRLAYAASLWERMTPRRPDPAAPTVIDLAEGVTWQRR